MKKQFNVHNYQRGAVLIVGLIMLLLLTVIGLASIRGTDLQERMAGNMRDHNLAFQAAEASLRAGEEALNVGSLPNFNGSTIGYYPDLMQLSSSNSRPPSWSAADWIDLHKRPVTWSSTNWDNWSIRLPASTISNVANQPQYVVERLVIPASTAIQGGGIDVVSLDGNPETIYYRITSRGLGGTSDSEVILQSTFSR